MIGKLINYVDSVKNRLFVKDLIPLIMPLEKVIKKTNKKTWTIYDTRVYLEFNDYAVKNSIHASKTFVKLKILKHDVKDKIILMGNKKHSNLYIVRWARNKGYLNVYCSYYQN